MTSEKHLVEVAGTKPPQPGGRGTVTALRVQVGAPPPGRGLKEIHRKLKSNGKKKTPRDGGGATEGGVREEETQELWEEDPRAEDGETSRTFTGNIRLVLLLLPPPIRSDQTNQIRLGQI